MGSPLVKCCANCARCSTDSLGDKVFCDHHKTDMTKIDLYSFGCSYCVKVEQDDFLKEKWDEFDHINYDNDDGTLRLPEKWWVFEKGTDCQDIRIYFDQLYSTGVATLLSSSSIR